MINVQKGMGILRNMSLTFSVEKLLTHFVKFSSVTFGLDFVLLLLFSLV